MFTPASDWKPPRVADLPDFSRFDVLGLDTETHDPNLKEKGAGWATHDGKIVGICLAAAGNRWYLPIAHPEDNVDEPGRLVEKLRSELKNFPGTLVGHNLLYDLGWCSTLAIGCPQARLYDTGFAAALLDEDRLSYSLDALARDAGLPAKDERLLKEAASAQGVDPKSGLHLIPARFVAEYGAHDAWLPVEIRQTQLPKLEEWRLTSWLDVEHALIPILIKMRQRGVRVDVAGAERLQAEFYAKRDERVAAVQREVGAHVGVDIWDSGSLAAVFQQLDISIPRTPLGRPSITAPWLEAVQHPIGKLLVQARRYDKAGRDFAGSMVLGHQVNGRLHTQFHPLRSDEGGTITGRFTSNGPNLQQVPARDPEIGPAIRGLFLPEEGERWYAIDYAAQEPRLTVHFASLMDYPGALEMVQRFQQNPATDLHQETAELMGVKRKDAKTINLGIAYGMRALKLCRQLGLPTEFIQLRDRETQQEITVEVAGPEGKRLMEQHHTKVPFISKLFDDAQRRAEERGWVRTFGGRLARFNLWEPDQRVRRAFTPALRYDDAVQRYGAVKRAYTYKAMNKLIQGSAADMIKLAMVALAQEGTVPHLTIHDELGFSFASQVEAKRAGEIMCDAVKLSVPILVDIESGSTWGAAKPIGGDVDA